MIGSSSISRALPVAAPAVRHGTAPCRGTACAEGRALLGLDRLVHVEVFLRADEVGGQLRRGQLCAFPFAVGFVPLPWKVLPTIAVHRLRLGPVIDVYRLVEDELAGKARR